MDQDILEIEGTRQDPVKTTVAVIVGLYFLWYAAVPYQGSFLDHVDLPIHETGHLVFSAFGEFINLLGGTLAQLIMPAAFVVYFFKTGQKYSAALTLFWVGQSLLNVYIYAADAQKMLLPLVGGGIHDWHYMLESIGMLRYTTFIAGLIRLAGTLVIFGALFLSIRLARRPLEQ